MIYILNNYLLGIRKMTPTELKEIMHTLYGTKFGAQRKLAEDTGWHEVSISRYLAGTHKPSKRFEKAVNHLLEAKQAKAKKKEPEYQYEDVENIL